MPIRRQWSTPSRAFWALVLAAPAALAGRLPSADFFRLKTPDGQAHIQQASDLCFGQVGRYDGLWIAPDRNSGDSGNKIFLIGSRDLAILKPGDDAKATLAFPVTGPVGGWSQFNSRHTGIKPEILADLRDEFENLARGRTPILDFEAIAIGLRTLPPYGRPADHTAARSAARWRWLRSRGSACARGRGSRTRRGGQPGSPA